MQTSRFVLFLSVAALAVADVPLAMPNPASEPSQPAEVRGVWTHPGFFGADRRVAMEKIAATLDQYKQAGINTLFVLVKNTSGYLYYASEIGVVDPAYDWDFFGVFLAEAKKRGMRVQPWFCVFTETAILGQVRQHPEWLISSPRREMVGIVNPALPAVQEYEISLMLELVRKYEIGWIHLDYIRYPCEPVEPYFSFDRETARLFEEETGIELASLKPRDTGNIEWNEWLRWNTERVTVFVRRLRANLHETNPQVRISAAVFPDPVNARILIGQNWPAWVQEGLVDMVNPMLYTGRTNFFEKLVREAMQLAQGRALVCPGIGIGIGTSQVLSEPEEMIEQMQICESLGAAGVVYFSSYSLTQPFIDRLKSAVPGAKR
jgi:uncharacterized lipoprotein YddW (UPF0748 family)